MSLWDDLVGGPDDSTQTADFEYRRAIIDHINRQMPELHDYIQQGYTGAS